MLIDLPQSINTSAREYDAIQLEVVDSVLLNSELIYNHGVDHTNREDCAAWDLDGSIDGRAYYGRPSSTV